MSTRPPTIRPRALLSASDKRGLPAFATGLGALGFELVSTGGTARTLRDAGLEVIDVATVTGAPEMLDGRVKTMHPRIAGGVLANLHDPAHRQQLADHDIEPFSLVVVNLYPFEAAAADRTTTDEALIEEIDIGGPTLVRAAAKNHASVAIVIDPDDYAAVLAELRAEGHVTAATRQRLALKAFRLTASYDAAIAAELGKRWAPDEIFPDRLAVSLRMSQPLRYGENPHQRAALYEVAGTSHDVGPFATGARLIGGKPLSYNNLLDAAAAAAIARDLRGHAIAIVKHGNPCGAAEAETLLVAWQRALATDPVSAFGGVVGVHGVVTQELASALIELYLEVVVAADFDQAAQEILATKPSVRLLVDPSMLMPTIVGLELRSAGGAVLVTESDVVADDPTEWQVVTVRTPTEQESADLALAWRIIRHVKSNAIVLARDGALVGVGAGQMSRVESAALAVKLAGERARGAVCASDAFFPFTDGVEACLAAGVTAVIQPGGSMRDGEVIAAADAAAAAMVVTGRRHFRH